MRVRPLELLFWICLGAVAYTFLVYPLLVFLLATLRQAFRDLRFLLRRHDRRRGSREEEFQPRLALLVAAHNEESVIQSKLENTARLEFPPDRMEFLLGLDAPTDSTPQRVGSSLPDGWRVFHFPERRGKLGVIHDLAGRTSADILVFSDANTMLEPDCLQNLARHFASPRVGAVCGELRLTSPGSHTPMESLYWRYEVTLKFLENRLDAVLGANGAVYAVRRALFRPQPHWIVEDFQVPMEVRCAGYRVVYDPEALGTEEAAPTFASEFRRKVRIGAGDFQTLLGSPHYLNPSLGWPAFAYFSHKVVRWLAPLFLLLAWISSALLAAEPVYLALFLAHTLFYAVAFAGYFWQRRGRSPALLAVPFYFTAMHLALLLGLARLLTGRQKAVWSVTPRKLESEGIPAKQGKGP